MPSSRSSTRSWWGTTKFRRERRATELPQVDIGDYVGSYSHGCSDLRCSSQFHLVALAVAEAEGVRQVTLFPGDGEDGGGVKTPAE